MDTYELIHFIADIVMLVLYFVIAGTYLVMAIRSPIHRQHNIFMIAWSLCYAIRLIFCVCDCNAWAIAIPNMFAMVIAVVLLFVDKDKSMKRLDILYLSVGILLLLLLDIPDLRYEGREIYDGIRNHKIYFTHSV